jgi:outer membrane biosynthesis protein TonB
MKFLALAVAVLMSHSFLFAQDREVSAEAAFLAASQPTVEKIPLPKYPDAAKGMGGTISVPVSVNPDGRVTVDGAPTGPRPLCPAAKEPKALALRQAAAAAAAKARFSNLSGTAVSGWIRYTFTGAPPVVVPGEAARVVPTEGARVEPRPDRMTILGTSEMDTGATPPGKPNPSTSGGISTTYNAPPTDLKAAKIIGNGGLSVKEGEDRKTISGGVLNGKAIALPRPQYPMAARAVRASGSVSVQVLIDEEGNVSRAEAISGHPLLRTASETAACSSRFSPTLLVGNPVKVAGVITYNYVP